MRTARTRSLAVTLLVGVAACGTAAGGAAPPPSGPAPAAAAQGGHPHTEADVHFMSAMIGHHAQALEMARLAPTHGASPTIRTLAERITNGQEDEIATMQQWLRDRGLPVPDPHAASATAAAHGSGGHHGHHGAMPGMLTEAQMRQLDEARGEEFDRLFLVLMIQHHRGATTMVRELFGSQGAALDQTVFKLASDVNADQTTEIARMQRMLASLVLGIEAP
jgi:uncharacterized protein (DUF305 family)